MILSECINEFNVQKKPLYVAAFDVQNAFDVVDHDSLLRKLYLDGISSPFSIKQGVRQGGILSATQYKRYNNSLLIEVEDRFTGKQIGTVRIPHVTVADDIENELQDGS